MKKLKQYKLLCFTGNDTKDHLHKETITINVPEDLKFLDGDIYEHLSGYYIYCKSYTAIVKTKENKEWLNKIKETLCVSKYIFSDLTVLRISNLSPKNQLPTILPCELEEQLHLKDYIIFRYNTDNMLLADICRINNYTNGKSFNFIGVQCYPWNTTAEKALKDTKNSFTGIFNSTRQDLLTKSYDRTFFTEIHRGHEAEAIWNQAMERVIGNNYHRPTEKDRKYNMNKKYDIWKRETEANENKIFGLESLGGWMKETILEMIDKKNFNLNDICQCGENPEIKIEKILKAKNS